LNIELISEYIKTWAYEKRELKGCDQFYIFAKQWRKEDIILRNGVDHLVTDSPIMLGAAYSSKYGSEGHQDILSTARKIEAKGGAWKAINIFLERDDSQYKEVGRWQDLKSAKEMDEFTKRFLHDNDVPFKCVPNNPEVVLAYVTRQLADNGVNL
jgi:hypothetical protein